MRTDPHHAACAELLETVSAPLFVPAPALTEAAYLVGRIVGPEAEGRFLSELAGSELVVEATTKHDLVRMSELMLAYADLPLGTVDASVVVVAERLGIGTVATLDHRHFTVVRPAHVDAFVLLP